VVPRPCLHWDHYRRLLLLLLLLLPFLLLLQLLLPCLHLVEPGASVPLQVVQQSHRRFECLYRRLQDHLPVSKPTPHLSCFDLDLDIRSIESRSLVEMNPLR
jgi:hypothetical protein